MRNKGVLNCRKPKQNSFFPKYEKENKFCYFIIIFSGQSLTKNKQTNADLQQFTKYYLQIAQG